MKDRLNAVSAPGIEVTEVKLLPDTAGNAMASVAAARYTVRFREGREPVCDVCSMINEFLKSETIMITKETKTGIHQVDIKEGIYELTAEKSSGGPVIRLFVDASSAGNIKPAKVIEALLETAGEQLKENALFITREDVYTRIVTDQGDSFISLDQTGRDITEVEASGEFSK